MRDLHVRVEKQHHWSYLVESQARAIKNPYQDVGKGEVLVTLGSLPSRAALQFKCQFYSSTPIPALRQYLNTVPSANRR